MRRVLVTRPQLTRVWFSLSVRDLSILQVRIREANVVAPVVDAVLEKLRPIDRPIKRLQGDAGAEVVAVALDLKMMLVRDKHQLLPIKRE